MSADFMLITFTLFLAGVIAVPIASRLGLGSVLGYLLAGIAISPLLRLFGADVVELQQFAEFGVVMMLFLVGLDMNPSQLWDMRGRIFVLGGLQVGVTTALVAAVTIWFGQPWTIGVAIGLILALSSTAIVNQTLKEKGLFKSDGGQASFSVLLFQDIAVIPMLIVLPLLALPELAQTLHQGDDHGSHGTSINITENMPGWAAALMSFAAIGSVIFLGRYLTDPIFHFVARAGLRELFVTTALMLVLGIALLMIMVGLSPALGTFLAGVVMAGSTYRHELESDIDPFRGIFLGIFFITVGAGINFGLMYANLGLVLGLTFGLIALKCAVLLGLARMFNLHGGDRWLFGLGLAQAGEFGFVLLSFSVANAVIPEMTADMLLLVVALSMLLTPALFILYDRVIAPRYSDQETPEPDHIAGEASVIIAGHGRFGGIVNRALRGAGYETTVVDYSSDQLATLRRSGIQAGFGDASRPDLLHAAGVADAKVLVIAIDDRSAATQMVRHMVRYHPDVHIVARAYDRNHAHELWSAGCRDIIRESYDGSLRAARSVFQALGYDKPVAQGMVDGFEELDRKFMQELAELYDDTIPTSENEAYLARIAEEVGQWEQELLARMNEIRGRSS